ncbi:MAG: hypothetical protein GY869_28960 [Planctomycetes bacterium]|nr:hypothetical protein [Planctomycetota bacterium]
MKTDDLYNEWLEHKQNIDISPDFTEQTMHRILQHQPAYPKTSGITRYLERLTEHPFSRVALIAAGLIFAVCRFLVSAKISLGNQW